MDFYARDSLGAWTPNHGAGKERKAKNAPKHTKASKPTHGGQCANVAVASNSA